jgi:hypothetical protein
VNTKGEIKMKVKLFMVFITVLTLGTFGVAQDMVSDVGRAAKDTGRVTEKTAQETAHGTMKATKATVHGTEKVAGKTADVTDKAAKGTAHGVKKVVSKI